MYFYFKNELAITYFILSQTDQNQSLIGQLTFVTF